MTTKSRLLWSRLLYNHLTINIIDFFINQYNLEYIPDPSIIHPFFSVFSLGFSFSTSNGKRGAQLLSDGRTCFLSSDSRVCRRSESQTCRSDPFQGCSVDQLPLPPPWSSGGMRCSLHVENKELGDCIFRI